VLLVRHWGLSDELARAVGEAGELRAPAAITATPAPAGKPTRANSGPRAPGSVGAWTLGNLACVAGALADREGFYLRPDHRARAEALADAGTRLLAVSELTVRRALDRLKEAVRLRE
jgi:hypothetical protein